MFKGLSLSEYRGLAKKCYRNMTKGQELPAEWETWVDLGHEGGITAFEMTTLLWYYNVTQNQEKFLWYLKEIRCHPNGWHPVTYCWMMRREIKKTLRRQGRGAE